MKLPTLLPFLPLLPATPLTPRLNLPTDTAPRRSSFKIRPGTPLSPVGPMSVCLNDAWDGWHYIENMSLALCHGAQTGQVAANFTRVFNVPEDTEPMDYWMTYGADGGGWWRPPVGEDVGVGGLGGRGWPCFSRGEGAVEG